MTSFRIIQTLFDTLEGMCSVIVTFPWYPHIYIIIIVEKSSIV